ncbi:hypothetical protein N431DRAFT_465962 [Stipitochalara longipes BDJ]|nr:hypothetical protein N431DRAFT_465962 [Stipitochalara longipes BDJ]
MLLLSLLKIASIASLAQAFVIPKGTQDGTYRVYTNAEGREILKRLESSASVPALTSPNTARDILQPQQQIDMYCGCGHNMDHGDCDAAVQKLKNSLGNTGSVNNQVIIVSGSVVAFICPIGEKPYIFAPDYAQYLATVTATCGLYVAGTYSQLDHGGGEIKGFYAGYMNNYGNYNAAPFAYLLFYAASLLIL